MTKALGVDSKLDVEPMSCPPFMNNTSDIVLTHELGKVLLVPNEDFALEWLMYVEFLSNTRLIDHGGNRMADLSVTRNVNKLFFCPTNICNPLLEVWAYLHKESRALRTWMACSSRMVMARQRSPGRLKESVRERA